MGLPFLDTATFSSLISTSGGTSNNWNSTHTTVLANSATTWNYQGTDLKELSGNWQNTSTNVQSNSGNYEDTFTTVQSNSGNWDEAYNISTEYQSTSGQFATNTSLQSVSSLLTPLTLTNNLTSQLVDNTNFNNYTTSVAATTATLLPTSVYQSISGQTPIRIFFNSVIVSGAGSTSVNGTYTLRGEHNGSPYYNLIGFPNNPFQASIGVNIGGSSGWAINFSDGDTAYIPAGGQGFVDQPWQVTWVTSDGVLPVPTVTPDPASPISVSIRPATSLSPGSMSGPDKLKLDGLNTASQMPSGAFAPSNLYQDLTSNWQNTFTLVNQKSAEFTLSEDSIFFDTNISEIEKSIIFGGITFQKDTAPVYDVINYDTSITRISSTGNTYGGFINISVPISISYDSYCDIKNIQNHKGEFTFTSSSQTSKLTSVSFPDLKTVRDSLTLSVLSQKGTLNFPELEYIGGYAVFGGSQNFLSTPFPEDIVSVNCPKLKAVINNLTIGGYGSTKDPLLSSVNFPQLIIVKGNFSLGGSTGLGARAFSNLIEINIPNLELCGSITFSNITSLTSFNFENLKIINNNLLFPSCTALREVAFPNVQSIGGYSSTFLNANTPSLTSISFPNIIYYSRLGLAEWGSTASLRNFEFGTNTLKAVNATFFNINQTLTQTSVDNLLKAFANLDGTNGTQIWASTLSLAGSNSAPSYTGGVTTTSAGTNFVRTETTVVASVVGHGHTTGDIVTFTGNTQAALNGTYVVTVNSPDQFEYTTTTSSNITGGGTVTMRRTTVSTDGFKYFQIIALRGGTTTINFPT